MRKTQLIALTGAALLAVAGAWIAATHAIEPRRPVQIDTSRLMKDKGSFPAEHVVNYSLVFE